MTHPAAFFMWKSCFVCVTFTYDKDELGHCCSLCEIPKTWEHFLRSLCIPSPASLSSEWSHSLFSPHFPLPCPTAHLICPEHNKRMPKNPSHPDVKHATLLPPKHVLICQIFVSPFMAWKICQPEAYFGFWVFRAGRALPETTLCKL